MKNQFHKLLVGVALGLILAACAVAPMTNPELQRVRASLSALQSDPNLGTRAPVAIGDAEQAVRTAEAAPPDNTVETAHLVYLADKKIQIARAQAEQRYAEDQFNTLSVKRDQMRLEARTVEADTAKARADQQTREAQAARIAADQARLAAEQQAREAVAARTAADQARADADKARQEAEDYRKQVEDLQAKMTDRGLVLTLGDVLFQSGKADLKAGAAVNLTKLVAFLTKSPEKRVAIEGHTDSVGSDDMNMGLSQRRADSVKSYLTAQGIDGARITATGKGKGFPVAGNDTAAGRQQNRRVEVIIESAPPKAKG